MNRHRARKEALEAGLPTYFTGDPCPRGHISARYTSCFRCIDCAKEDEVALIERRRAWRLENPIEKSPRAKAKLAGELRYKTEEACKNGHFAERLTINGGCVECQRISSGALNKTEEFKKQRRQYRKANAERYRTHCRNRRSAKDGNPDKHSPTDIEELHRLQKGRCAYCATLLKKKYHVDHIKPRSLGGSNLRNNLQLTCGPCNRRKHTKDPLKFSRELGRLC